MRLFDLSSTHREKWELQVMLQISGLPMAQLGAKEILISGDLAILNLLIDRNPDTFLQIYFERKE